ncbi:MAG: helix-turn-helix domain-containing protein [Comamonadaceae bacterium]|jgi:DNA-binding transcriptional MocR family regulator|nr:helix-turn-helix domain-containing protein [Comamonadaceae bacterium]MBK7509805.1 helix-turn-helix domain-containing protein [Comamonadaceae bacterium]
MTKVQPQTELFEAQTTWFHVFKNMIDNGDVAKMGPHACTVYLVIKAHTNYSTGMSFPAIETIAVKSGISVAQVKRELVKLESMQYITKEKKGRSNHYTLREKVDIKDDAGRPSAVATWDYLPSSVTAAVADLKNVLVTGKAENARIVHIERLTVNIANSGGIVLNMENAGLPPEIRAEIEAILKRGTLKKD